MKNSKDQSIKNRAKPTYGLTVCADPRPGALTDVLQAQSDVLRAPVSYTHLTLPTICSV